MSFEGYYQLICRNGHYMCYDVYDCPENTRCDICNAEIVWKHIVDLTNGSYEFDPDTEEEVCIDGYIEL